MDFTVPDDHRVKLKEREKKDKYGLCLNDSKSLQVNRILLSILVDLNDVVVWVVSTRPLIFKFSNPFNNPSMNYQWKWFLHQL